MKKHLLECITQGSDLLNALFIWFTGYINKITKLKINVKSKRFIRDSYSWYSLISHTSHAKMSPPPLAVKHCILLELRQLSLKIWFIWSLSIAKTVKQTIVSFNHIPGEWLWWCLLLSSLFPNLGCREKPRGKPEHWTDPGENSSSAT